jgi:hypothetical protein
MIFFLVLFVIACFAALFVAYDKRRRYGIGRTMTGIVEHMRLTFGQQGQQIVTINGVNYNIWLPFREFNKVEKGNVITHQPFWDSKMGVRLLSTKIIDVQYKNKKNAPTQTKPHRGVSA